MSAPQTWGEWAELDYSPIPLLPGTKRAAVEDWPSAPIETQWAEAGRGCNVGLRCGNGFAVIDADNAEAARNVSNFLAGLGYYADDVPTIATPRGVGRHFYATLTEVLPGQWKVLSPTIGKGELRFGPGAYVGAPPSVVGEKCYAVAMGDLRQLPHLTRADVMQLLKPGALDNAEAEALPTLPTTPRHVNAKAWRLLHGQGVEAYASRSEAEAAAVASLICTGHDFESVARLFTAHDCAGKFAELHRDNPRRALRWLRLTFDNETRWLAEHETPGRKLARHWLTWANARAWPGRTGSVDRAIFNAHCEIAMRSGRAKYGASCRELGELSGVSFKTAATANARLLRAALILPSSCGVTAKGFALPVFNQSNPNTVKDCVSLSTSAADVWRVGALGKTGAEVWGALKAGPNTPKAIATLTGRNPRTVKRVLTRMAAASMAERIGKAWRALPEADLNAAAVYFGTAGKADAQKAKHKAQREARRAWITMHKDNRLVGGVTEVA